MQSAQQSTLHISLFIVIPLLLDDTSSKPTTVHTMADMTLPRMVPIGILSFVKLNKFIQFYWCMQITANDLPQRTPNDLSTNMHERWF